MAQKGWVLLEFGVSFPRTFDQKVGVQFGKEKLIDEAILADGFQPFRLLDKPSAGEPPALQCNQLSQIQ